MASRIARLAQPLAHLRASSAPMSSYLRIARRYSSTFDAGPSPPRLPPNEQAEFERLQRTANTQEGFNPRSTPESFQIPITQSTQSPTQNAAVTGSPDAIDGRAPATPAVGDNLNTPLRKGAPPEFEGDVNPKTGEVGGPKNEPLRWGAGGDYSYNGRVTDF
ncbi:DUF1674-domain-containing protein [Xylariaceae sp. FL0016]|nr:DUF1674-domain-containing protein [Xylariaceae sp. FL0016]